MEQQPMTDVDKPIDGLAPIRVLVADDQELVRDGFAMIINTQPDMQVVGRASTGEEAVRLTERLHPDVVLMDVRMPVMDGIEATKRICQMTATSGTAAARSAAAPVPAPAAAEGAGASRVIILTTFDLDEYVMSAILAGASGFLLKDTEPETLLSSIRTVHEGNAIIAPTATKRLLEHMVARESAAQDPQHAQASQTQQAHQPQRPPQPTPSAPAIASDSSHGAQPHYHDPELDTLTAREREILIEIAHGLSNQEIASKLFISLPTVKSHVTHILQKTHAHDRVQAAVFAYENHLV